MGATRTEVSEPPKKGRSDAERNRTRLIEVAKAVVAAQGTAVSLERVAREAGVGIGTLYRHFPTRDALIEAVYREEIDRLIEAATRLAEEHTPEEALRAWLLLFVEFLDAKMGMAAALGTLIGGPEHLYDGTPARLDVPVRMLVERARNSGALSVDVTPMDYLRAIVGVASVHPGARWKEGATRIVDVLLRGTRRAESAPVGR